MNNLSWFLYLADLVSDIEGNMAIVFFMTIFIMAIWGLIVLLGDDGSETYKKWLKPALITLGVILVVTVFIPTKKTMYLIAASEASEYVVTSPEGQEIINDIKLIIRSQIDGLK